jgi:hypothetical protein
MSQLPCRSADGATRASERHHIYGRRWFCPLRKAGALAALLDEL